MSILSDCCHELSAGIDSLRIFADANFRGEDVRENWKREHLARPMYRAARRH